MNDCKACECAARTCDRASGRSDAPGEIHRGGARPDAFLALPAARSRDRDNHCSHAHASRSLPDRAIGARCYGGDGSPVDVRDHEHRRGFYSHDGPDDPGRFKPAVALSGFSAPSFWILVAVLFYGFAMQVTGLARRIAYYTLSLFPATYTGISFAFLTMGFVLTLGIPSSTVRTAIMVPVAWALVKSLDLADRSRGAALIMLTTVEMAVVPGSAILYGSLYGVVIDTLFHTKHLALTWLGYINVMFIPTVILCLLLLAANRLALRPEPMPPRHPQFARLKLQEMGRPSRAELVTGLLVIVSIVFWATERYHHIPSFFIGMIGVPVLAMSGILREEQIGTAVPWNLLLFLGGAFSLANVIQQYDITAWIAGFLVPAAAALLLQLCTPADRRSGADACLALS